MVIVTRGFYVLLFIIGLVSNCYLLWSIYKRKGSKSYLLISLIVADILVCCVSGPITIILYEANNNTNTTNNTNATDDTNATDTTNATDITSTTSNSTTEILLIVGKFFQHIPVTASTFSITAMSVDRYFTVKNYSPIGQVASRRQLIIICVAATWLWAMVLSGFEIMAIYQQSWEKLVTIVRITLAHIVPGATVLMAHLGVYAKLTAMSLTARAKHGELPLPIPLIRRPTHVIIVAGMPQGRDQMRMPAAQETNQEAPPETSTLKSRKRLACWLLAVSVIFICCWLPYMICLLYKVFSGTNLNLSLLISLYIGQLHSAVAPVLYLIINQSCPKWPCDKFRNLTTIYRSASSTNEAALGPFNPRFVKPTPYRRRSSLYLY